MVDWQWAIPHAADAKQLPAEARAKAMLSEPEVGSRGILRRRRRYEPRRFALYFLCQLRRYVVILDYVKNLKMSADEAEKRANAIRSLEYL